MNEPEPFVSPPSGLLARKGAARLVPRPQGFGQVETGTLEDLGWNDMGFEPPKSGLPVRRDETQRPFLGGNRRAPRERYVYCGIVGAYF